jgi:hypothetical protein
MHPDRSRSHGPGGLKRCSACGEEKRAADFYVSRGRLSSYCKDCQRRRPDVPTTVAARTRPPERACEAKHRPAPQAPGARTLAQLDPAAVPHDPGRKRRNCSDACKQAAYPARKRAREQARQRAQDDARRQQREEQARRQRDRTRRTPPRTPGPAAPALTAGPAAATAVPTPLTTTRPPTTAPGAATTADTPRPPRPGSPRKPPTAGPSRAAPGQVRSVGDDGRIVTRPSTEQGERYGSSATAATNGS